MTTKIKTTKTKAFTFTAIELNDTLAAEFSAVQYSRAWHKLGFGPMKEMKLNGKANVNRVKQMLEYAYQLGFNAAKGQADLEEILEEQNDSHTNVEIENNTVEEAEAPLEEPPVEEQLETQDLISEAASQIISSFDVDEIVQQAIKDISNPAERFERQADEVIGVATEAVQTLKELKHEESTEAPHIALDLSVDIEEKARAKAAKAKGPRPLTKEELATRLNTSVASINSYKKQTVFFQWSKHKDPDQIGWAWDVKGRKDVFYPEPLPKSKLNRAFKL